MKYFIILCLCAFSFATHADVLPDVAATQSMLGITLQEKNDSFQRFSFGGSGDFLISQDQFQMRSAAMAFCKSHDGYELSDTLFSFAITMSALPFSDLRQNNIIDKPIFKDPAFGDMLTATIFWVQGTNATEEQQLSVQPDMVLVLLNGCGPNCLTVEPLSTVNARLLNVGEAPRGLQAVCTSDKLRKTLNP